MADIEVNLGELRASAGMERGIGDDLATPISTAVTSASTAAGKLTGWSLSGAVQTLADGWKSPLGTMRQRVIDTASNLDTCAQNHEQNDRAVAQQFPTQGGS
ncbi:hypothetical protein E6W39_25195 [Kitasatospora acidiphila]|uniref:Excreted virulence factor EspC (Type VII ESX diderm) n=1 Tax=Kitasatospora acidiphila TaxID=2567942 RepID=A0A540W7C3_9ACTN|nr:hypothetical protein [Kitasatospora acidiphila]TQF04926.1 hypothetical protein E6W39_25195 [Kitasatospora acidiphila]